MEFFSDLTYYNNFHYENALNVGFSHMGTEPVSYPYPESFIPKLMKYLNYPLNVTRGGGFLKSIEVDGVTQPLGFAEMRVLDQNGRVYAAPDAVVAYIMEGLYVPPEVFIDAVVNGIDPESAVYQTYLSRYAPQYCWGAPNDYVVDVATTAGKIAAGDLAGLKESLSKRPELLDLVTGNGSLLHEAILHKQEDIAKYLVDAGISLNRFEGDEILVAVESGSLPIVVMLIDAGIPIKADRPRTNPLFLAIGRNQNEIAMYLYNTRKDLVDIYSTEFVTNCNILQWTKMCNNPSFMDFLLKLY
jgi:hypothetical protein